MFALINLLILIFFPFNDCLLNKVNKAIEKANDKLGLYSFEKYFQLHTPNNNTHCIFNSSTSQFKSDLQTYDRILHTWLPCSYIQSMHAVLKNRKSFKEGNPNVSETVQAIENIMPMIENVLTKIFQRAVAKFRCLKQYILQELDKGLASDEMQITDEILLVKNVQENKSITHREIETETFWEGFTRRIKKYLEAYSCQMRLGTIKESVFKGRIGSHGYRHAFPMMVGSFMLLAAFMVPMGFQFLAVVGGKALILSQIALFLAMGGNLQSKDEGDILEDNYSKIHCCRYFGWRGGPYGGGNPDHSNGFIQHEYHLQDDLHPWHRQGSQIIKTQDDASRHQLQLVPHQSQLTRQQLHQYMS